MLYLVNAFGTFHFYSGNVWF